MLAWFREIGLRLLSTLGLYNKKATLVLLGEPLFVVIVTPKELRKFKFSLVVHGQDAANGRAKALLRCTA